MTTAQQGHTGISSTDRPTAAASGPASPARVLHNSPDFLSFAGKIRAERSGTAISTPTHTHTHTPPKVSKACLSRKEGASRAAQCRTSGMKKQQKEMAWQHETDPVDAF